MKKLTTEQKKNIKTALELLCEESTTLGKVSKIATLLKNTNPKVEEQLKNIIEIVDKIKAVQDGDVIGLSAEKLPEDTEEKKKRKKLVLLLIQNWKSLGSEVSRINDLYSTATITGTLSKETTVKSGKILATMKGPLGVVTIIAAGIVAVSSFLNNRAVEINVKNIGCGAIPPISEKAINIPGLKLPSAPIASGGADIVKMPGIDIDVDIEKTGSVSLGVMGVNRDFYLPSNYKDVIFDGKSLMGNKTVLKMAKSKSHELILRCK